jgi:hypothetical protein
MKFANATYLDRKSRGSAVESLPCLPRLSRRAVEPAVGAKSNGDLRFLLRFSRRL